MKGFAVGRIIAFKAEEARRCRSGKVFAIFELEQSCSVHRYSAKTDGWLRVVWTPDSLPSSSTEPGASEGSPLLETVECNRVLGVVELHSGVLGHASARRLDIQGWKIDESVIVQGAMVASVGSEVKADELSWIAALQHACNGDLQSALHFQKDDLQRWAKGQIRVFVEVFIGTGALTLMV